MKHDKNSLNTDTTHKKYYKTYKILQTPPEEINDTGHKDIKNMEQ